MICDLSFPHGVSVNDGIRASEYLGNSIDLSYPMVDSLAARLKVLGPGCYVGKKDLKKAYRQFLLDPRDIHLTGYCWKDQIYLDLALVMGARSAAYLCQRVTNAVSFIASQKGVFVINYLDDLCMVSLPSEASHSFEILTKLLDDLGLVEAVDKSVEPSTKVEFLGVQFDTEAQTMEVTPSRLEEIHDLILVWLQKKTATKKELQLLIGKLNFICKCVFSSRVFICRLLGVLRQLKRQSHRFRLN